MPIKTPNDMPHEWHNDAQAIRNAIMELDSFECVDLHWERDDHASNAAGEIVGEWELYISHGRSTIKAKHAEITNCLWFAVTMMDEQAQDAYKRQQDAKKAALAKLTPEDRRALGLA